MEVYVAAEYYNNKRSSTFLIRKRLMESLSNACTSENDDRAGDLLGTQVNVKAGL